MVKSKKMSKTSIAVIVLAILLTLSLVLGLTGAWFTANGTNDVETVKLKFGTVEFDLTVGTTVTKTGYTTNIEEGDPAEVVGHNYYLVAGSEIETGIKLANTSNVATYYVIKDTTTGKFYYIDGTTGKLVELVKSGDGANVNDTNMKLAKDVSREFKVKYIVDEDADNGTAAASIFEYQVWDPTANAGVGAYGARTALAADQFRMEYAYTLTANDVAENGDYYNLVNPDTSANYAEGDVVIKTHNVLTYDDSINLGTRLVTGTYEFRAIQADNLILQNGNTTSAEEAYDFLTNAASEAYFGA